MASFGQAMKMCLKSKLFNFHDRAPRSEFWWFALGGWILGIILTLLNVIPVLGQIIYIVGSIWLFIATLSVGVRRLHDLNRSGWWLVFPYVALVVGIILIGIGAATNSDFMNIIGIVLIAAGGISVLVLWIMMIVRGTVGTNSYGPDPLGENKSLPQA